MTRYSLELDLQDPRLRPFAVHTELNRPHYGVKDRASRVCGEAGVVESAGCLDSLSNHLKLGVGERHHVMPEEIDTRVSGACLVGIQQLLNTGNLIFRTGCQYS